MRFIVKRVGVVRGEKASLLYRVHKYKINLIGLYLSESWASKSYWKEERELPKAFLPVLQKLWTLHTHRLPARRLSLDSDRLGPLWHWGVSTRSGLGWFTKIFLLRHSADLSYFAAICSSTEVMLIAYSGSQIFFFFFFPASVTSPVHY